MGQHAGWVALGTLVTSLAVAPTAEAVVVWTGDMETGDGSQWDSELNGNHITYVTSPVAQGMYAAHIELTNDAIWQSNGLKRVELHHGPDAARTAEGAETYFAWSFYLPEALPTDPSQTIGYWESGSSYKQMMAFSVAGEQIRFVTRQPMNVTQWQDDTAVTAGQWHRIAMHIKWSKDPLVGLVDVWFDNAQVVTGGAAKTLNDDNPHFTQVGLLRSAIEFTDAPVILIDDAVEGDTLEDVRPDALLGGGGQGGAGGGSSSTGSGGSAGVGGSSSDGGSQGVGGAAVNPLAGEDGGCGCDLPGTRAEGRLGSLAMLLMGLLALRRRRPLSDSC